MSSKWVKGVFACKWVKEGRQVIQCKKYKAESSLFGQIESEEEKELQVKNSRERVTGKVVEIE